MRGGGGEGDGRGDRRVPLCNAPCTRRLVDVPWAVVEVGPVELFPPSVLDKKPAELGWIEQMGPEKKR